MSLINSISGTKDAKALSILQLALTMGDYYSCIGHVARCKMQYRKEAEMRDAFFVTCRLKRDRYRLYEISGNKNRYVVYRYHGINLISLHHVIYLRYIGKRVDEGKYCRERRCHVEKRVRV